MGIASLTLGITSLATWINPTLGLPISIVGIILGTLALRISQHHKGQAIAGVVTSVIGLLLNVIFVILGLVTFEMFPKYFV